MLVWGFSCVIKSKGVYLKFIFKKSFISSEVKLIKAWKLLIINCIMFSKQKHIFASKCKKTGTSYSRDVQ